MRRFPCLLALVVVALGCRTVMSAPQGSSHGAWSPVVGGLRGRLVVSPRAIAAGGRFDVDLELENVGAAPFDVQVDDPMAFTGQLEGEGRECAPTSRRLEVMSAPRRVELGVHQPAKTRLTIAGDDVKAELDMVTAVWKLPPGHYRLSGRWTRGAGGTWSGTLELPAVDLEVR